MARFNTPIGTFEAVRKPVFAEIRESTAYFKKKAEDLDVIEQLMAEVFMAARRARPGFQWSELEQVSPEDIERIEDEPEPEPEFVPDPLDDATQTGASA